MVKDKLFEKQFEKRYGKKVGVMSEKVVDDDGNMIRGIAEITSEKGKKYTLVDNIHEGATVNVFLEFGDKQYIYRTYLEAEVNVADAISEE